MISGGQLLGFTAASLVMIVIPRPGVLFVIGRALAHGRRTALATACGHAAGNYVVAAFVAVGLGAILQRSATAFVVVKVIGAGYLVWLGIQAIRHRKSLAQAFAAVPFAGLLCIEHAKDDVLPELAAARTKRYGDTSITFITA